MSNYGWIKDFTKDETYYGWPINWDNLKAFNSFESVDDLYVAFLFLDEVAFEELFLRIWNYAFGAAKKAGLYIDEFAEEGAQDAFIDIYLKKPNFEQLGFKSFKSMLAKIARWRTIEIVRAWNGRNGQKQQFSLFGSSDTLSMDNIVFDTNSKTKLEDIIPDNLDLEKQIIENELWTNLPRLIRLISNQKCRRAFRYYIFKNKTLKDIGEIMNLTESRVCQLVQEARKQLRKIMIREGFIDT